ncbi:nuclear transport factor 2 family protein [Micromonospora mangrovi]|uniref:Nuclear transport factor 2 family protein n=2 Tax=Micromonospora TaxID=1873 RepID=A0AAU7ME40_9ACTN
MKVIDRYIESWNETEPAQRRLLIDEVWAEDGRYTDPLAVVEGRDAIAALIGAVQGQFPGLRFSLGPVDAHHDIARFTWALGAPGAEPLVVGFDVAVFAEDGRIARVHGFLDKVPA